MRWHSASGARASPTTASLPACRSIAARRWSARSRSTRISVYAEDFENAVILLSRGERIYYDGRLVVSTEGPGVAAPLVLAAGRLVSRPAQGVLGALRQDLAHQPAHRRSPCITSSSTWAACRSACISLKMVSAVLLVVSFAERLRSAVPGVSAAAKAPCSIPVISSRPSAAISRSASSRCSPSCRRPSARTSRRSCRCISSMRIAHIVPMTVGFMNWIALQLWGRRVYRDHYEPDVKPSGSTGSPTPPRKAA